MRTSPAAAAPARRTAHLLAAAALIGLGACAGAGLGACSTPASAPAAATAATAATPPGSRNLIIFVADGLRRGSVNATDTPALLRVRREGVDFANSHAVFPSFTTPNASAIATGHQLGDTGDFGNTLFLGFPIFDDAAIAGSKPASLTPFIENDLVLADTDAHIDGGNYLDETSLLALARQHGYNTAAIGKLGPVAIQDVTQVAASGGSIPARETVFLDDATGTPAGIGLAAPIRAALAAAGLPLAPPPRMQPAGDVDHPGTLVANGAQQQYFVDALTRAILPAFAASGRPFAVVYWSRDPDGSQHNEGDSLNRLVPGINGPTGRAGVADADANLGQILAYLDAHPALAANTDLIVTSDHGFATISKHEIDAQGHGSRAYATGFTYRNAANDAGHPEVRPGWLPPGFLAIDLAHALDLPLYDPDTRVSDGGPARFAAVDPTRPNAPGSRQRPALGNGLIGGSGTAAGAGDAEVIVAANGGSDLVYVPDHDAALVQAMVAFLGRQDYVGALFVDPSIGRFDGALSLEDINLVGAARTPRPALVVAFKTFALDMADPLQSAVQIADTGLQEGQGMHGSLGRDNTFNNMAAMGPDFKRGYADPAPVGNADLTCTLAQVLGLPLPTKGMLQGRVLDEALAGGPAPGPARSRRLMANGASGARVTILEFQSFDGRIYLDRARFDDPSSALPGQSRR